MKELKQHTCALLPEGIAGIFLGASVDRERIFIQSRKGFVKLAIQAGVGADLAPNDCCHVKLCAIKALDYAVEVLQSTVLWHGFRLAHGCIDAPLQWGLSQRWLGAGR